MPDKYTISFLSSFSFFAFISHVICKATRWKRKYSGFQIYSSEYVAPQGFPFIIKRVNHLHFKAELACPGKQPFPFVWCFFALVWSQRWDESLFSKFAFSLCSRIQFENLQVPKIHFGEVKTYWPVIPAKENSCPAVATEGNYTWALRSNSISVAGKIKNMQITVIFL